LDKDPGQLLKNPPKDYSADDPAIEYLKYKSFTAVTDLPDRIVLGDDFLTHLTGILTAIKPLITFLNTALLTDENGESIV
jgi:hypothetical protein